MKQMHYRFSNIPINNISVFKELELKKVSYKFIKWKNIADHYNLTVTTHFDHNYIVCQQRFWRIISMVTNVLLNFKTELLTQFPA